MQESCKMKRELNGEKKNMPLRAWVPRENTTMISEETVKSSLLENQGTWLTYKWTPVTVSWTSEASPLRISYPGIYSGLNHYIRNMPFTWTLSDLKGFDLHVVRKNELSFHSGKETSSRGVSSDWGEMFTFFFFRNIVFWQSYLVSKTELWCTLVCTRAVRCVV